MRETSPQSLGKARLRDPALPPLLRMGLLRQFGSRTRGLDYADALDPLPSNLNRLRLTKSWWPSRLTCTAKCNHKGRSIAEAPYETLVSVPRTWLTRTVRQPGALTRLAFHEGPNLYIMLVSVVVVTASDGLGTIPRQALLAMHLPLLRLHRLSAGTRARLRLRAYHTAIVACYWCRRFWPMDHTGLSMRRQQTMLALATQSLCEACESLLHPRGDHTPRGRRHILPAFFRR